MPGVLVDSPNLYFPFDSGNMILSGTMSSSFESSICDPSSQVPTSPFSLHHELSSPPPSPSDKLRDPACGQQRLPRSKLGPLPRDDAAAFDSSPIQGSDLCGLPIPSPAKPYRTASGEAFVGSPVFSDLNSVGSPVFSDAAITALQKFLPSNNEDNDVWPVDAFPAMDVYSCDDFRMYEFKVRRCMRGRSHDWTECPFAHPGEKARRRDPRRFHYSGTACPDFRKGNCKKGDACEYAHGVFECWLHPARYRTQPCKDGRNCRRRVCFFAHTVEQLRVLPTANTAAAGTSSPRKSAASPASYDGSPWRQAVASALFLEGSSSEDSSSRLIQKFMDQQNLGNGHGFPEEQQTMGAPRLLQKVMDHGYVNMSSSPTSTLLSHSTSPPPLSPPLSPPVSPPMSPDPTVISRSRAVASAVHVQSPLSNTGSPVPAHRRHLNRLQSVPTLSIPPAASDLSEAATFDDFSMKSPGSGMASPSTNELANYLQTLQLRSRVIDLQRARSTPSTPQDHKWGLQQQSLRQCLYRNIPGTPDSASLWSSQWSSEAEVNLERVESGRDLRANFYGKIGKENGVGSSETPPDLGWVNELVK